MNLLTRNLRAFSPNHFKRSFVILCWKLPPSCVTLYFMTIPPVQAVNEEEHLDQITPANIDHEEIVEYAKVSSVKELAEIIIAQNNFTTLPNPTYEQCSNFLEFLHHCKFQNGSKILENIRSKYW